MGPAVLTWAIAAGVAAGSIVLVLAVWSTERRLRSDGRSLPDAEPTGPEAAISIRVVHVAAEGQVVTVDALVDDAGGGRLGPTGMPVALRLRRSETPWFDETTRRMLEQWAEDCRVVQVAVRQRDRTGGTATLRSGASTMKLGLVA